MTRAVLALLLLVGVALPKSGHAVPTAACRGACAAAVEGCIAWRSAALRDSDASPRVLRRKAKAIRRGCAKTAVQQCRTEGAAACDTPVTCACGR